MRQLVAAVACVLLLATCVHRLDRKVGVTLQTVDREAPFLKVHMFDGSLYVLSKWSIDDPNERLSGEGDLFDAGRTLVRRDRFTIQFADVAMYETNTIITSPAVAAMAVVTGLSLAVTVACLANPKACFGSCPTFYAVTDDGTAVLQAEGFSAAIAPALEYVDVDALWRSTGRGGTTTIVMTNEAYETHVVKQVDLLAVPRPPAGRVLSDGDRLWVAPSILAPRACTASEGTCLDVVSLVDGRERTSTTDARDLGAREDIELAFEPAAAETALVIGARQSLVTTFLLYQGLAYLGATATKWLVALDAVARRGGRAMNELLAIEVLVERDGTWVSIGKVFETGPIATDVHLVRLPPGVRGDRVRLRLPRGAWRIDYLALATIAGEARPIRIAPAGIRGTLGAEYAGGRTPATEFPIVTMPGDRYELAYDIPDDASYELFLASRGYYLEWMRAEWLREQDPIAALRMLGDPERMLKELAPRFKQLEPDAERIFWRSRYARP